MGVGRLSTSIVKKSAALDLKGTELFRAFLLLVNDSGFAREFFARIAYARAFFV
jgi:hypothetical protein